MKQQPPSQPQQKSTASASVWHSGPATALLLLQDGSVYRGHGFGATGVRIGELCFNTSMTGYQEIITDPSYAGQIITFTFPHIGIVGCNAFDGESATAAALGVVVAAAPTPPSSYRADRPFAKWLENMGLAGITGVDTRALTQRIRDEGAMKAVLAHSSTGAFDLPALKARLAAWPGMAGMELAKSVTIAKPKIWQQGGWQAALNRYADGKDNSKGKGNGAGKGKAKFHVIAMDYGCKQNILRCLIDAGCRITSVPATATAADILAMCPHGIVISNGPGDPAATANYSSEVIRTLAESGIPIFGICIGHQLLAEAFGGKTYKMQRGHRGGNHPVKRLTDGAIEITSQNHGFAVDGDSLPADLAITHISLFDGSIEGLCHRHLPVFSVQYHPESSPGPHDSRYLFSRFTAHMAQHPAPANSKIHHASPR